MSHAAPAVVLLPLAAAPLLYVVGRRAARATLLLVSAGVIAAVAVLVAELLAHGSYRYALGDWGAPVGIDLRVDGLAALMLALTAVVFAATAAYADSHYGAPAIDSVHMPSEASAFWPLLMFLWASVNALVLADDIFNIYVALELLGLAAVMLVTLDGGATALAAGTRYLFVSLLGSAAYLAGVALLYTTHGALSFDALHGAVQANPVTVIAFVSMIMGLSLKTALFPFHGWLPAAHASAPTPVSALLSALVVKASFVVLLRLWVVVFPPLLTPTAGVALGLLGACAIVWGSLLALRQPRLKMIVAFSTVSQLGYLFVLLPVAYGAASATAWQGGVLHVVAHALAKAALFLSVGAVIHAVGSDRVADMHGLAARAPLIVLGLGLAGLSLVGLPPSAGFVSKWLIVQAALERGQWGWAVVMIAGSLLTAVYVFRVLGIAFARPAGDAPPTRPAPRPLALVPLLLALVAVALGQWSAGALALLDRSDGFPW
jgi:multicomponent Na+:H+ antiporter subunit D